MNLLHWQSVGNSTLKSCGIEANDLIKVFTRNILKINLKQPINTSLAWCTRGFSSFILELTELNDRWDQMIEGAKFEIIPQSRLRNYLY